ncbi:hypothetical protein SAMN05421831_10998 [Allopseudospirillum japonicum]|uniref:Uncharacterized protein n=1 Tax=Allopseudospirillum japonicum TaxID=64971 RepID=A0A1H6TJM3_9GAMM|nr:hypothetical protein [Allopseudospirillum japonicum]SEI75952.1 hypothetical protein SAMN05421831_10998 [Allopseudospirillum japonicum]
MRIDLNQHQAQAFNISQVGLSELPKKDFQQILQGTRSYLENSYSQIENYKNNPVNDTYAEVVVDSQVVATLDNNGYLTTSNAFYAKYQAVLDAGINPPGVPKGPELAQARAEFIAQLTGGRIRQHENAMDQTAYEQADKPFVSLNIEGMLQDPLSLDRMKIEQARRIFELG